MKRFRITLLILCLLLLWLGVNDLERQWRNPSPQSLSLQQLLDRGTSREWVTINGGYQDLLEAISTSGTLELDALLVPLKRDPHQQQIDLLFETRDPELLKLFSTYNFQLDSEQEKQLFRQKFADRIIRPHQVTGMIISGLAADNNREKLKKLATELGLAVQPEMLFVAEGENPNSWRGYLFLGAAVLGLLKFAHLLRRAPVTSAAKEVLP